MRYWAMTAAGACLLMMSVSAGAAPATMASGLRTDSRPAIQLAQAEPKKETMTQKVKRSVKRTWRNLTGYKFDVACLFERKTCTETGKDRAEARGKCIAANPLCVVSDAK